MPQPLELSLAEHCARLLSRGERRFVLLTGNAEACQQQATALWQYGALWLGDGPAECLPQKSQHTMPWLGQEYPLVVVNGFSGLSPEILGAVGGAVRAGGLLVLLMPALTDWSVFSDPDHRRYVSQPEEISRCYPHFLQRLLRLLQTDPDVWLWDLSANHLQAELPELPAVVWHRTVDADGCLSTEQHAAMLAVEQCALAAKAYPLVIMADRGRGKSTALGLAARHLLAQGKRLVVTAPSQQSAQTLFRHAGQHALLSFYSPEMLLEQNVDCDLLLVDEAAAIPAALLRQLQQKYQRVVYATTIHGYEGSGHGFELRMCRWLATHWPHWQQLTLTVPLRWAVSDPLEPLLANILLLDADASPLPATRSTKFTLQQVSSAELLQDEALLRQLFGLLVLAHYQTSPTDLRLLLDCPDIEIWLWRDDIALYGVALLMREGPIDRALAEQIWAGRRRPRGQLLPQTLLAHCGYRDAANYRYRRVMRIAVHPACQQQGLGSQFMAALSQHYQGLADFLGCSFAATPEVLRFWRKQGWQAVRLGLSKDVATGCHAAVLLLALRPELQTQLTQWQQQFQRQLPVWLAHGLSDLTTEIIVPLLQSATVEPLTGQEQQDLLAFSDHHRSPDHCWPSVLRAMQVHSAELAQLPKLLAALLIQRFWQGKDWVWLAQQHQLAGQKAVVQQLRQAIKQLLLPHGGEEQ
ncbi:GNAT family N-acetyltransferase [uncultured Tolumonas sp.]|uniref:tRNA(Met) cytidine acetyltransferase TmcA n=1 Tax=uncultured Tolumonas sp. TaxID=263765 RepID=UPI002A0A2CC0|nr:GNAT family N-acetyltransferase [uncultured Tolumonas sp.]